MYLLVTLLTLLSLTSLTSSVDSVTSKSTGTFRNTTAFLELNALTARNDDDTESEPNTSDYKDCVKDCKDEFSGDAKDACTELCLATQGKCPDETSNSKCKDDAAVLAKSYDVTEDDAKKMCDIICPKSIWWVFLIVGLVVVIAVVVILVLVCFFKKLLCFKGSFSASVAPSETATTSESVTVDTQPDSQPASD